MLFTGGFGIRKGAKIIIEVMRMIDKVKLKYSLNVIGSIVNDVELPDWFTNSKNVRLHGHLPQDDLKSYLGQSDLYIFPSYSEGAAQSLIEAMAAGLPVIATEQSEAPIVHGENGRIISDDSVEELKEATLTLSKNKALREKLGRNVVKTVQAEQSWEKYSKNVLSYIQDY